MLTTQAFEDLRKVVEEAGTLAYAYVHSDNAQVSKKDDGSVVTEIDTAIEAKLVSYVRAAFPGDMIVGEEGGVHTGQSGAVWHIDPIDGTSNFMRKIPFCALSVARLSDDPSECCAIVYNPLSKQMFYTYGPDTTVYENGRPCAITADSLGGLFKICIARGRQPWMTSAAYALCSGIGLTFGACGWYGSAALEHTYVAANRLDGVLTFGLSSYDYAAGLLLCVRSGATVSVFQHGAWNRYEGSLRALCMSHKLTLFTSHEAIHQKMLDYIGDPETWATRAVR